MGKPAARIGDIHVCPMVTPGLPPIPHVGGPITLGNPKVLIGKMPAACMGDMCTCVGPPDSIVMGSLGVMIGKKPAARMGDPTAHGGSVTLGCLTVLIGDISPGPVTIIPPPVIMVNLMIDGQKKVTTNSEALKESVKSGAVPPQVAPLVGQISVLLDSAQNGTPFCEKCEKAKKELDTMEGNQQQAPDTSGGGSNYITDDDPGDSGGSVPGSMYVTQ